MSSKKQVHHLSRAREDDTGWCEALSGLPDVDDDAEDVSAKIRVAPNGNSEMSAAEAFAALLDHSLTALQAEVRRRLLCHLAHGLSPGSLRAWRGRAGRCCGRSGPGCWRKLGT